MRVVRVTLITFDGREQTIDASVGMSLMENAVGEGVDGIDAECGGNCYCGTCRVYPVGEWQARLGGPGEFELPVIETTGDETACIRLSCQILVSEELEGLVVRLPEAQT
jgi:2Fe-2S ferredoxin